MAEEGEGGREVVLTTNQPHIHIEYCKLIKLCLNK